MCNNLQFFFNLNVNMYVSIPIDNQVRYKKRQMTDEEEEEKAILDDENELHEAVIRPPASVFKYQESNSSVRITPSGSSYGPPPKVSKYKESYSCARITPSASSTFGPDDSSSFLESNPYSEWSIRDEDLYVTCDAVVLDGKPCETSNSVENKFCTQCGNSIADAVYQFYAERFPKEE
jgi:hypothetical protein